MKPCKLLLASVGATVLLGAFVASASADAFESTSQRIRGVFTAVEFHLPSATARCALTIEGTLHSRSVSKTARLLGYITRADLGACATGAATVLTSTLPWHVKYAGFSGVLPEISSIITRVIGASLRVKESGGIECLVRSSEVEPVTTNFHRNTATRVLETAEIRGTIRTGIECLGIAGSFRSDRGVVSVSNAVTRITVTLI